MEIKYYHCFNKKCESYNRISCSCNAGAFANTCLKRIDQSEEQEKNKMQDEINMLREKCGQVPTTIASEDKIKPSYYHKGKVDTIQFCIENKLGFCEGNIVKYIVRYADKNGMEDLLKVKEYLDRIIKNEEGK